MNSTRRECRLCAHSYFEPDGDYPVCGHKDSGMFGLYVGNGHGPDTAGGHCGPDRVKFEQHPLRQEKL